MTSKVIKLAGQGTESVFRPVSKEGGKLVKLGLVKRLLTMCSFINFTHFVEQYNK